MDQALKYEEALFQTLDILRDSPQIGIEQPHTGPDLLSHATQQHVIYYRTEDDVLEIVRILHQRQHASGQFD